MELNRISPPYKLVTPDETNRGFLVKRDMKMISLFWVMDFVRFAETRFCKVFVDHCIKLVGYQSLEQMSNVKCQDR